MKEPFTIQRLVLGWPLTAQVFPMGEDYAVLVTGGCRHHLGSVSTAYWENQAVRCETSLGQGHRDDVVSRRFAAALAQAGQCGVSVNCGIHYDNITKEDLAVVLAETEALLAQLTARLRADGAE